MNLPLRSKTSNTQIQVIVVTRWISKDNHIVFFCDKSCTAFLGFYTWIVSENV